MSGKILHLPLVELPADEAKPEARTARIDQFYDWIYRRGLSRMSAKAQQHEAAQQKDRAA